MEKNGEENGNDSKVEQVWGAKEKRDWKGQMSLVKRRNMERDTM